MTDRFLFKSVGPDDGAFCEALKLAYEMSKQNSTPIHLVFPLKNTFKDSNIAKILNQLDSKFSTKLLKGETVANMDLLLPSNIGFNNSKGIILAVYCTTKDLNLIDSNSSADSIIFVSWSEDEAEIWESTWYNKSLQVMYGNPSQAIAGLPTELVQELERLTSIVNLSTGLAHPSDKEYADRIFKSLKSKGYKVSEQLVANWAIANGWNARHLDDLVKLAKKHLS